MNVPANVDWMFWRVVASPRFHERLIDVQEQWSIDDLAAAHAVIDMLDEYEVMARREAERT